MLKRKEFTVVHSLFGKIRVEEKFARVLEIKEFRQLAFKTQLGMTMLNSKYINARHTRYMHSIGVMYLTEKLLDCCEKKFGEYIKITDTDRETLKLAALGHDVGHYAFSHSLEERSTKTHEERTIEIFEIHKEEINEIFGYNIVDEVIAIYKNNIVLKRQGVNAKQGEELNILFILTSLLIGTIDCDRMEYLMTDKFMVTGEKVDFTEIFDYITIVLLNDAPAVGFKKEAVPLIENMLITRLDQYQYIYYNEETIMLEMVLKKFLSKTGWYADQETMESLSEYDILEELSNGSYIFGDYEREKEIILDGKRDDDLLFKKFEEPADYEYFLKRLNSLTERRDIITTTHRKTAVYNPRKNKVYIKDDDGIVKDIMQVSRKIKEDLSINLSFVMVDLNSDNEVDEEEAKKIRALFNDNPVESEKKFVSTGLDLDLEDLDFELISDAIGAWEKIFNIDTYLEPITPIPEGIVMRHRKTNGEESYYIKIPADDGTSITRRKEFEYKNCTLEEFLDMAADLFKLEDSTWNKEPIKVVAGVKISTKRYKTLLNIKNSIIEIARDFSNYEYNGKSESGQMIECELKQGDDLALWYLTQIIKKSGFEETNESKLIRAKKALNIE